MSTTTHQDQDNSVPDLTLRPASSEHLPEGETASQMDSDTDSSCQETYPQDCTSGSSLCTNELAEDEPKAPEVDILSTLPPEIIQRIISHLLGGKVLININVRRAYGNTPSQYLHHGFPTMVTTLGPLLTVNKTISENAIAVVEHDLQYKANSIQFVDLPSAFGRDNCLRIKNLDLHLLFLEKTSRETTWPALLDMFTDALRNLERFELWAGHSSWRAAYPEHESGDPEGSVTRQGQECKSLMHFAAFLTLRHPRLQRIIHDVRYGPTYGSNAENVINNFVLDTGNVVRVWNSVQRKARRADIEVRTLEVSFIEAPRYLADTNRSCRTLS